MPERKNKSIQDRRRCQLRCADNEKDFVTLLDILLSGFEYIVLKGKFKSGNIVAIEHYQVSSEMFE